MILYPLLQSCLSPVDVAVVLQHTDQRLAKHWGSLEEKKGVVDFIAYI